MTDSHVPHQHDPLVGDPATALREAVMLAVPAEEGSEYAGAVVASVWVYPGSDPPQLGVHVLIDPVDDPEPFLHLVHHELALILEQKS